jgi:hypothetical protein
MKRRKRVEKDKIAKKEIRLKIFYASDVYRALDLYVGSALETAPVLCQSHAVLLAVRYLLYAAPLLYLPSLHTQSL